MLNWYRKLMNKHFNWKYVLFKGELSGGEITYVPAKVNIEDTGLMWINVWFQRRVLQAEYENILWYKLYW